MAIVQTGSPLTPAIGQAPWQAGRYYAPPNATTLGVSATLGTNTPRAFPISIPNSVTLARIGAEVTVIGDVGSKIRLGIYADDGTGRPGSLLVDAGTIAGDSVAVQEITISTPLAAGIFWLCGVVQVVTVTQPTVRVYTNIQNPTDFLSSILTAGAVNFGYTGTAAAGALNATFGSAAIAGQMPRIFVRA
jgi:hypothetical protein